MRFPKIATLATFAAVAALALTGCSSGPADAEPASTPQTTSAAPTTEAAITKDHVAETTSNPDVKDLRTVTLVKVIDLNHIEVTPAKTDDALFGETFTLAVPGYKGPVRGECGFAEAAAFAEDFYVAGNEYALKYATFGGPLAQIQDGEHQGKLYLSEAEAAAKAEAKQTSAFDELEIKNPVAAGFALPDHEELIGMNYDRKLEYAQKNQNGLHTLCPGYGQ